MISEYSELNSWLGLIDKWLYLILTRTGSIFHKRHSVNSCSAINILAVFC